MPSPYSEPNQNRTLWRKLEQHRTMHLIKHGISRLYQCNKSSQRSTMSKHILNSEGTRYVFIQLGVHQLCLNEQACALLCQFH